MSIAEGSKVTTEQPEHADSKNLDVHVVEHLEDVPYLEAEEAKQRSDSPFTARDIVTEVLTIEDDSTINPWTFRTWFIGISLSIFASSITSINTFRPQRLPINTVLIVVISYIMGIILAAVLPNQGKIGKLINPGSFNSKEHAAACIMVSAASSTPESMTVLAVQKLYYNMHVPAGTGILLIISAQMLGLGVIGGLREKLVYPSKMLYPEILPSASLLDNLHRDRIVTHKRMKMFYFAFAAIFIWQVFPQYIMPVLANVSIFCLTNRNNLFVTNMFGGSMANEGLGVLALSFDWTTITAKANPFWVPHITQANSLLGYLIAIGIYIGLFYSGSWRARDFPFMSPLMFTGNSTRHLYEIYNQTAILNKDYRVEEHLLAAEGLPWLSTSYILGMLAKNIGLTAIISHMIIWHWGDIGSTLSIFSLRVIKDYVSPWKWNFKFWQVAQKKYKDEEADAICPHFRVMQAYDEVPSWWFVAIWILSAITGLVSSQNAGSTLPVWAFFVAIFISACFLTFFATVTAIFGFLVVFQSLVQSIGALLHPGKPIASLYFTMFGYNSLQQAKHVLTDLKLGQYVKLAPKCTFFMEIFGTVIGSIVSYLLMSRITTEKRDILMSIQGTNFWSGQTIQEHNSAAIGWGGLASQLYAPGGKYPWISISFLFGLVAPFPLWLIHKAAPELNLDYWNTAIIFTAMGNMDHGTHSGLLLQYGLGFFSQVYLRKYRTNWFIKYNYILSAGLDGGAAFVSFILSLVVFGAGRKAIQFPPYWGNNFQQGNYDYCMRDPGLGPQFF